MAKVEYADMIKTVSGALTKINKKSPHAADQKMVLATHREAATTNPNCQRVYVKPANAYERTTPVKPAEIQVRTKFSAVSRAVAARKQDVSKITSDQAAFNAQKDQPGGKKTLNAYLWMVCGDLYDQNQG